MGNDIISRSALLKRRFRMHSEFVGTVSVVSVKDIDNAPTVEAVPKEKYDELKDKYDRLLENSGYMAEALKNYEAVDVVRCKECKFLGFKDFSGICRGSKVYGIVTPNDYCSWGERK